MLVLSGGSSGVFLCSFITVIGMPVGIASASISLVFPISNEIVKMFPKTIKREKIKNRKTTLLSGKKMNSIEKKCLKH